MTKRRIAAAIIATLAIIGAGATTASTSHATASAPTSFYHGLQ